MLLKSYEYENHEKYHIMTRKPVHELPKLDDDEFPLPPTNMDAEKGHEENEGMKHFVNTVKPLLRAEALIVLQHFILQLSLEDGSK